MKRNLFASILAGVAVGVAAFVNTSKPSLAETPTYFCGTSSDGVPTTFARTPRGEIAIIRWETQYFSSAGYPPQQRCQLVSDRLERARAEAGGGVYITHGIVNGLPVICTTDRLGDECKRVLITLRAQDDPKSFLEFLFEISKGSRDEPIIHGDSYIVINENNLRSFIDISNLFGANESEPRSGSSRESGNRFLCGMHEGRPATMIRISGENFPLIRWIRDYYPESEEDPLTRCRRVSGIFETYRERRILNYLTTEIINGERVVCVASQEKEPCSRLLFKLPADDNSQELLRQIRRTIDNINTGESSEDRVDENGNKMPSNL